MSDEMTPADYLYQFLSLAKDVNKISTALKMGAVFSETSLTNPKLTPSELGFIRVVSWLYVHYFEAGKIGVEVLVKQMESFNLEIYEECKAHRDRIQTLRTYCQHNLNPSAEHDKAIIENCETWFQKICGTSVPGEDTHWEELLISICTEAVTFLTSIKLLLREIEADDSRDAILATWQWKIERSFPPYQFDRIIEEVTNDLGVVLDASKLRLRHYDAWRKTLELQLDAGQAAITARKLVEMAVLTQYQSVLPITGKDIMEYFEISPGTQVKDLLQVAKGLCEGNKTYSKAELLNLIRENQPPNT